MSQLAAPYTNEPLIDLKQCRTEFFAGGIASSIGVVVGFPLDAVKAKLQVYPDKYKSIAHVIMTTVREEGGFPALYNGCVPPIAAQGLQASLTFMGEAVAMSYLDPDVAKKGKEPSSLNSCIAGSFGGLLQCFVLVPSDVIKCKMQTSSSSGAGAGLKQGNAFSETIKTIKSVLNASGVSGFYRGFGVTLCREIPAYGSYFFAYRSCKDFIHKYETSAPAHNKHEGDIRSSSSSSVTKNSDSTFSVLMAGGMAGSCSWALVYPVDVIKTNMQVYTPPVVDSSTLAKAKALPPSWHEVTRNLYRVHGIHVFYTGLGATLLRAFPVNAITFFFYEKFKLFL